MHNNTLFYKTVDFAPFQNTLSMLQSVLGGNTNERKKKMLKRNLLYAVYDLDLKLLRKYIRDFCFFFSCITYFLSHYSINTCFLLLLPLETIPLWKNQFVLLFFDIFVLLFFVIIFIAFACNKLPWISHMGNNSICFIWECEICLFKYRKRRKKNKKTSSLPQSYFSRKGLKRARLF